MNICMTEYTQLVADCYEIIIIMKVMSIIRFILYNLHHSKTTINTMPYLVKNDVISFIEMLEYTFLIGKKPLKVQSKYILKYQGSLTQTI